MIQKKVLFTFFAGVMATIGVWFEYNRIGAQEIELRYERNYPSEVVLTDGIVEKYQLSMRQHLPITQNLEANGELYLDFGKARFATLYVNGLVQPTAIQVRLWEVPDVKLDVHNRFSLSDFSVSHVFKPKFPYLPLPMRQFPLQRDLPEGIKSIAPFRYAHISSTQDISSLTFAQSAITASLLSPELRTRFRSSSSDLDAVWGLTSHTAVAATFAGFFLDGQRERLPYEADALIGQLALSVIDPDTVIARRTYALLDHQPTWPLEWMFLMIEAAKYDYQSTDNLTLLRQRYPRLEKRLLLDQVDVDTGLLVLDSTTSPNSATFDGNTLIPVVDFPKSETDGIATIESSQSLKKRIMASLRPLRIWLYTLVGFDFVAEGQRAELAREKQSKKQVPADHFVIQAYHQQSLRSVAELAAALGQDRRAKQLEQIAYKQLVSIKKSYFDPELGLFLDRPINGGAHKNAASFHSNLFALAFGIIAPAESATVLQFVIHNRKKSSVFTAHFLLEALYRYNAADAALEYLVDPEERGFLQMINKHGSSMTMEAWNRSVKPNLDWNHVWGASPAYHIISKIVGYNPNAQSQHRTVLVPRPASLSNFDATVATASGPLGISYHRSDRNAVYEISFPSNWPAQKLSFIAPNSVSKFDISVQDRSPIEIIPFIERGQRDANRIDIILKRDGESVIKNVKIFYKISN